MPTIQKTLRMLDFIKRYQTEHLVAPTMVKLGEEFGMRSTASVHRHLKIMESRGMIKRERYGRYIWIVERERAA